MSSLTGWLERSPWSTEAAVRVAIAVVVGAAVCGGAWYIAAGKAAIDDQVTIAPFSVAGLVIAVYAMCSWLVSGRRAIGERIRDLQGEATDSRPAPASVLLADNDLGRYHRPQCPIVRDSFQAASRRDHETHGRRPCGVCQP